MFVQTRPSDPGEKALLEAYRRLSAEQRATLVAFAEFLASRPAGGEGAEPPAVPEPEAIPRPAEESVVKAIKRLTRTYPMLENSRMLGQTSELVSQHVLQGRPAREVIDELEAAFRRSYERLLEESKSQR